MPIWKVALPVAGGDVFDYLPPNSFSSPDRSIIGCGVSVPFGNRTLTGVVIDIAAHSDVPKNKLRLVRTLHTRVLDDASLALLQFAARHYHHPLGLTVATALPSGLVQHQPRKEQLFSITESAIVALEDGAVRGTRQREILQQLQHAEQPVPRSALPVGAPVLRSLQEHGWIQLHEECFDQTLQTHAAEPIVLRQEQQHCANAIDVKAEFRCHLVVGATGSGKTEIYLERAAKVIATGGQVLMLVPEIALTPQMISRVRKRIHGHIALAHSQRSDSERCQVWKDAMSQHADLVLATRSGVFFPMPKLGLIIVDEEHDASYKQQDGLRYSARNLAIYRAQLQSCPIILGSATPALESIHNAMIGRYQRHDLQVQREGARELQLVDMRPFPASDPISPPLRLAMQSHLSQSGQVFLFLNRRGYSPVLYCPDCQWNPQCHRCDSAMVWHRADHELRCHHCDRRERVPHKCPECENPALMPVGWGTQRVVEAAQTAFPEAKVLRFDRDSLRGKGALESALETIENNEVHIIVGTQMLAKGHDFPHLSLAAIVDADSGLYSSDFRATERLGQLLTQVRGRAGRRSQDATCIVQTRVPEHPHLQAWLSRGYPGLSKELLQEREEAGWPPFAHLALLSVEASDEIALKTFWQHMQSDVPWPDTTVERLGPVNRPRRAGRHRSQMLFRSSQRQQLGPLLQTLRKTLDNASWARKVRWAIDVDPWSLE